jgi:DNA (cytosine-5)-methyltransferase 1
MRHLDLFSGIGGFALAARWSGFETVAFCEIDQYCQKVLAKHWPQVPIYSDIKKLTRQGLESDGISQPDIITGGFPCQPFSVAGKQRGQDDNRHLWPEMLRIISELHPAWVVGENVYGFVRLALDDCISDLENQGYAVQSFVIPACAVNAPHRRDRVWIVANSRCQLQSGAELSRTNGLENKEQNADLDQRSSTSSRKNVADSASIRPSKSRQLVESVCQTPSGKGQAVEPVNECLKNLWATESNVGRVVDGIPSRVDRLKGLGNAVVPQLVYNLFEIIKQVDNNNDPDTKKPRSNK